MRENWKNTENPRNLWIFQNSDVFQNFIKTLPERHQIPLETIPNELIRSENRLPFDPFPNEFETKIIEKFHRYKIFIKIKLQISP